MCSKNTLISIDFADKIHTLRQSQLERGILVKIIHNYQTNKLIKKINTLKQKYNSMTDEQLAECAQKMKATYSDAKFTQMLPDAFALVREVTKRQLGKEHYDVQLMSGIALAQGKISEAKTGEGKTITIYLPAFLASLAGKGVHIVTVNDYLASRDANDAAKVFNALGFSVGCVLHTSTLEQRKDAYQCDMTYVTNSELGFDYLKDHVCYHKDNVVLRGLHYAIIDEVDSILIDEAKTPLIISGPGPESENFLFDVHNFVKHLDRGNLIETSKTDKLLGKENFEFGDFIVNEKENQIYLTEQGTEKVQAYFKIEDYDAAESLNLQRAINNALRANYMLTKNKDYVVRDDKVEIVDGFTGRVLTGRRFSDGLHQAIEVKEHVSVQKENITIATITFQNFFNKYEKKAGLTGTAMTSEKEFKEIYNLDVIPIPTNKPVIRQDLNDLVYRTKKEKWEALVERTVAAHNTHQPILIGTSCIEDSEIVSEYLTKARIEHNVLNAKNEALEAEIIAEAGKADAVTVATNMAGRGTDIILDQTARDAGGLLVLGTERHESRRIDNQLKGRSGRQGDPGTSQFMISLEDRLMSVFAEQSSLHMLMSLVTEPGQPLEYKPLTKIVEKAQAAIETENRLIREHLMKYDMVNNEYREEIYRQRDEILNAENPKMVLTELFYDVSDGLVDKYMLDDNQENWNIPAFLQEYYEKVIFVNVNLELEGMKKEDFKHAVKKMDDLVISVKENQIGDPDLIEGIEKTVMLRFIDRHWATFLNSMEYVKSNIGSYAYAQKDPVIEYQKRGGDLFNEMVDNIKYDIVSNFMHCQVRIEELQPDKDSDNQEQTDNNPPLH